MPLIVQALHQLLHPASLVGATASSVLGGSLDSDGRPAISVWASTNRGSSAVRFEAVSNADGRTSIRGLNHAGLATSGLLVLFSDPFSFPTRTLVDELSRRYPQIKIVGGIASGAPAAGGNRLVCDRLTASGGAVGLTFGNVDVAIVLAQAGEPIGDIMTVTAASGPNLVELAGRPALTHLIEALGHLDDAARFAALKHVQLGIASDESAPESGAGAFTMLEVTGTESSSRVVRLDREVAPGTTAQFHLRSGAAAAANVWKALTDAPANGGGSALVFVSKHRNEVLFHEPHTDANTITDWAGGPILAGMATLGEIGPARSRTTVHAYAAAIALFRDYDN
ncbi:MAG: hypothetical protein GXP35_05470 [Actinobacteria bacterium]|nr:hypothetical protein [Actinomycetota bacterium]